MSITSTVRNPSTQEIEKAKKVTCPECKGFGNTSERARKDQDCICLGKGIVWSSKSSVYRPMRSKLTSGRFL